MKVYEFKGFPNPTRVRIALAEKGALQHVEFVHVDVPNGEHRQAPYLAKNPSAAVPLLELDDGTCISECTAITDFIDQHFSGISLMGESAKDRGVINMMQRRVEAGVLEAIGGYFHHATAGLMEVYQNKEWGLKQKERALDSMQQFDSVLAEQPFVAGQSFSVADITLFAGLAYADFVEVEIPQQCNHLKDWRTRIAERPAVIQAIE